MSISQQSLSKWVEQLNDAIFYQTNDEVASTTIKEKVDPSLAVRVNHSVYTYEQFKGGLQHIRSMGGMILESVSEILEWNDPENQGGVVAHMTKFMNKDAGTGKESKKTSVIISTVKWIDGERSSQS